jgi:plasmid stabilization system protein ParE
VHAIFSDRSLDDLREIHEFVSRSSEAAADQLIDELIKRSEELPSIKRHYAFVERFEREGIRRRNVRTWAIFYRERDTYVDIIRIVHGGRDISALNLGR